MTKKGEVCPEVDGIRVITIPESGIVIRLNDGSEFFMSEHDGKLDIEFETDDNPGPDLGSVLIGLRRHVCVLADLAGRDTHDRNLREVQDLPQCVFPSCKARFDEDMAAKPENSGWYWFPLYDGAEDSELLTHDHLR
jgi:hypothetical protein